MPDDVNWVGSRRWDGARGKSGYLIISARNLAGRSGPIAVTHCISADFGDIADAGTEISQ
jgi:hypothetical protein